ncbi:MAG: hypothetical protein J2P49_01200, partial [Methylocapsa sp.]|nr:hypothetical protein [Methylocapsa sp.]
GTVLPKIARDKRGATRVALDDEPCVLALLATALERPVEPYLLAKIRRACELWNEGEKALAHIHLAHAGLPICDEERALRLFAADEILESGVTQQALLKAQGFNPELLSFEKYNTEQPRVPAGNGRESGQWTSNSAGTSGGGVEGRSGASDGASADNSITVASDEKDKSYEDRRARGEESPKEDIEHGRGVPLLPDGPLALPPGEGAQGEPLASDPNKLHHIFDKLGRGLDSLVADFGSQEAAFSAIKDATQEAVRQQNISGQYEIEVTVHGQKLTVRGKVMSDGTVKLGTIFP